MEGRLAELRGRFSAAFADREIECSLRWICFGLSLGPITS